MDKQKINLIDINKILIRIDSLEDRIAYLESERDIPLSTQRFDIHLNEDQKAEFSDVNISISSLFETRLGEYGLAWLGNIVLFFAIAFLWQYFNDLGKPFVSLVVGLVSVAAVLIMSHYSRKSFAYLSKMFNLFGFIILYFILLRLHFYTDKPLLISELFAVVLLLSLSGVHYYLAIKNHSAVLSSIAASLALITAFVSNAIVPFFLITLVISGLTVYLFWKYNWWKPLIYVLCLTFFTYLVWLIKSRTTLVKIPNDLTFYYAFTYFSLTTAIYSLVVFHKENQAFPASVILSTILLSGMGYSILMLVLVVSHFPKDYVPFFIIISVYSIVYSVLLKLYSPWKYSPALFALFGFFAISITIIGIYHFPSSFLLLVSQSFLVLILALWYRSHIITLMNTFLLLFLILAYYTLSGELNSVNFSIPIVAFLSARLINWQKERLNIKTDFIRNIYLSTLFFALLYATYKGIPGQFITITWLLIAAIYFGLSILVKSIKYRWMAMSNLLVSACYLFMVDLAKTDLIFRILAFLVFAIISMGISVYYVKKLKRDERI